MSHAWIRRLLIVAVLVALATGGVLVWQRLRPATDERELTLYGNVDIREVQLAINGNDRIAELLVEEGDRVEKGQLLARLDLERLEISVARAEAQAETQRQVVARLVAGTRPEEIRKAKADLEAAQASEQDTKQTYERIMKLIPKSASQQQADDAKGSYDAAVARTKAAQAALDLAIAGPRVEDIAEAKAALKRYEAELAQARHDLKDAHLHAPADGIIENRLLEVGDMASPQKPVFTMALVDPIWIRAYVPEPQLGKLRHRMVAQVTTDSFPGKTYEGWVGFISPTAEFTPKPVETEEVRTRLVYEVRVFVPNPQGELRLGMPATVRTRVDQAPDESLREAKAIR
jgi:HlyD family secretion protein